MNSNLKEITGLKELFFKKVAVSVFCSVLSNLAVVFLFIIIVNFNVQPLEWLSSTLNTLVSFNTLFYLSAYTITILIQIAICSRKYVWQTSYPLTRFQKCLSIFSLQNFILVVLHVIVGAVMVSLYLALVQQQNAVLFQRCKNGQHCLVEENFVLLLGGMWTGFYFFTYIDVSDQALFFPVIQQRKLLFFKSQFLSLVNQSRRDAFYPTVCYFILYNIFGRTVREYLSYLYNFNVQDSSFDVWIFKYSYFFSILYILNMTLMQFFFKLYLMEPIEHPITSDNSDATLADAVLGNVPILQHLACLDLYLLSNWSYERRKLLFTLSQPGGHPYVWNQLFQSTLKLLTTFTDNLNDSINRIIKEEQPKVTPPSNLIVRDLQSPTQAQPKFRNMRNMCMTPPLQPDETVMFSNTIAEDEHIPLLLSLKRKILSIPLISYLFGERPEAYIQFYIKNGQLIIWTAQGLANMAVASFYEDPYGVIQRDLPVIATTLVNLKISLEKLNKLQVFARRKSSSEDFNFKMKNSLNAGVKRSLCNICKTYGKYFPGMALEKNVSEYLKCYL